MKILHFVHGWFPRHSGGTEQYVDALMRELADRDFTVAIVAGSEVASDVAKIERNGDGPVPVYRIHRSGLYLDSWYQSSNPEVELLIGDLIADLKPDLIHVHHWRRLSNNLIDVASELGVPAVLTLHDTGVTCAKTFRVRNDSFCLRDPIAENCNKCVDRFWFQDDEEVGALVESHRHEMAAELDQAMAVLSPSKALVDLVEQYQPQLSGKIEVLPHPRLYPSNRPAFRPRNDVSTMALAYWGALQPMKGVHVLLEALHRTRTPQSFSLDVWGALDAAPEDYVDRLYKLAEGLNVRFRGAFEARDIPANYDLAVFPSLARESYSFTVDEAWERGIPTLVPDKGAPAERSPHRSSIFKTEDASDLGSQLQFLLDTPAELEKLATSIPELPDLGDHVDELLDIYDWCIEEFEAPTKSRLRRGLSRMALIQKTIRARDDRLYALRGRADGESEQSKSLLRELEERDRLINKRDEILDEFNANLGALTKTLDDKDRELEAVRKNLVEREAFLSYRADENVEIIDEQKKQLAAYELSTDDLRASKDVLNRQLEEVGQSCSLLEERIEELNQHAANLVEAKQSHELDLAEFQRAAEEGEGQREQLMESIHEYEKVRDRLKDEIQVLTKTVHRNQTKIEELNQTIKEVQVEGDTKLAALANKKDAVIVSVRSESEAKISRINADKETAVASIRDQSEARIARAFADQESVLEANEQKIAKIKAEREEQIEALTKTCAEQNQRLQDEASSRGRLEAEVRGLRQALLKAENRSVELGDEMQHLEREKVGALDRASAMSTLVERTEHERDEHEREAQELEEICGRLKSLRDNLMQEVELQTTQGDLTRDALDKALSEIHRLDNEFESLSDGIRHRLAPIAEEVAPHALEAAPAGEVMDLVVANHGRLHRLIGERDEVLSDLVLRIDGYEARLGQGAIRNISSVPSASDVARKLKSRVRGLSRRLKPKNKSARKRVLFVVHDFLPKHNAGTEIYTYNLARGLQSQYDVHLLFCEARHELPRYTVSKGSFEGLPYTEVVHNYQWENFEETYHDNRMEEIFLDVLDEFEPDIIHIQHLHYFSFNFIPLAKKRGLPVVYTLHEFMLMCARGGQLLREDMEICEFPEPSRCADCIRGEKLSGDYGQQQTRRASDLVADLLPQNLKLAFEGYAGPRVAAALDEESRPVFAAAIKARLDFIREQIAQVDLFISPSAFLRQKFIDSGMIRSDQIVHSGNGFDLTPFAGFKHQPSETLRFGFVGTIAEYKGVHILVEAMNDIVADNVELQIWGDVETFAEYKAQLLPLIKNSATKIKGRFDNNRIAEVLSQIDVLIVPSLWFENSPLTIHEAWLAKVPLVVSDRGGMAELVQDGVNGFHFKLGDSNDLRKKLMRFVQDRTLIRKLGDAPGYVKPIAENVEEMSNRYRELMQGVRR